jgi:ParB/RepB/Spo0J family partition protein
MTATATKDARQQQETLVEFHQLHVDTLTVAGDNVRRDVGDVTQLAASIKAQGMIQPIVATVRDEDETGARLVVVAGHRRLAAAKQAGLETVPVILRTMDEQQRVEAMIVENLEREDLTALEEASGYERLIDEFGLTQRQLAEKVSRSQGHISKRLALLDLPKNVQAALDSGGIEISDALELSKLKDMPKRLASAYARGVQWRGQYARAVQMEIDEQQLAEKIGASTKKLKDAKVTIVKTNTWGEPGRGKELDHYSILDLKLTPANHKNQPCHAAFVNPRNGQIVYICTSPATHKGKKLETPADEKEKARREREAEKRAQLRARAANIEVGALLEKKLAAVPIDARNLRLLVDLLMLHDGTEIANRGLRYVNESGQTVITKKDGAVSRIVHPDGQAAKATLQKKLKDATTPEEIMGVFLQALVAASVADTKAVPPSQRYGSVRGLTNGYARGNDHIIKPLAAIAKAAGIGKTTKAKP